jgi:carboxyl-terminal processing protease
MQFLNRRLILASVLGLGILSACQKEVSDENSTPPPTTNPPTGTNDPIKDTVLAYSQDIYLWYNQIPSTFDPQPFADPNAIMTEIRKYSIEPGFTAPVDRWSFAIKKTEWDNISSGISGDFGLGVFFRSSDDLRVKSVEEASPAGQAGIHRGWRITKINGNSNITTNNTDFIVENVFGSPNTSFTFVKPDNTTVDITLTAATYREHPLALDTVYNVDNKKIGYLVFNSFLGDTTEIYNDFSRVFSKFAAENVNDVVVDLRYNGGGYVTVQQKLANYLAPSAANGNLMMKQEFNDKYAQQLNSADNFSKIGGLNLDRIFFIVSNSTASASELLINNLKPYMSEVLLVGPSNTYGKPVGYFPIGVADWYIFPVSFRSTNKNGEGNYFDGIQLSNKVADGLDKDWGDLDESCLASAVKYITTGAFRNGIMRRGEKLYVEQPEVKSGNIILDKPSFKGAIDTRKFR